MKILFFLLLLYVPNKNNNEIVVEVDKIVLNHYVDSERDLLLSQFLLMKWQSLSESQGYRVMDWFLAKDAILYRKNGYVEISYYKKANKKWYILRTKNFRENYSSYDIELKDRQLLNENNRDSYMKYDSY